MDRLFAAQPMYPLGLACDSPNSLYLMFLAISEPGNQSRIVFHSDSETYTGIAQKNITSYIFALYYRAIAGDGTDEFIDRVP
jgi:hypothetical protein